MLRLSKDVRLKHNEHSDNYYLFCIKTGKRVLLNSMSYEISTLLTKGISKDSINDYIESNYEIDRKTCSKDINEFLSFLEKNGMVQVTQ